MGGQQDGEISSVQFRNCGHVYTSDAWRCKWCMFWFLFVKKDDGKAADVRREMSKKIGINENRCNASQVQCARAHCFVFLVGDYVDWEGKRIMQP